MFNDEFMGEVELIVYVRAWFFSLMSEKRRFLSFCGGIRSLINVIRSSDCR